MPSLRLCSIVMVFALALGCLAGCGAANRPLAADDAPQSSVKVKGQWDLGVQSPR